VILEDHWLVENQDQEIVAGFWLESLLSAESRAGKQRPASTWTFSIIRRGFIKQSGRWTSNWAEEKTDNAIRVIVLQMDALFLKTFVRNIKMFLIPALRF